MLFNIVINWTNTHALVSVLAKRILGKLESLKLIIPLGRSQESVQKFSTCTVECTIVRVEI